MVRPEPADGARSAEPNAPVTAAALPRYRPTVAGGPARSSRAATGRRRPHSRIARRQGARKRTQLPPTPTNPSAAWPRRKTGREPPRPQRRRALASIVRARRRMHMLRRAAKALAVSLPRPSPPASYASEPTPDRLAKRFSTQLSAVDPFGNVNASCSTTGRCLLVGDGHRRVGSGEFDRQHAATAAISLGVSFLRHSCSFLWADTGCGHAWMAAAGKD
jgi:hypothetical protein